MAPEKLSKKGWVDQTSQGEKVLVNEKGVAYKVNESIIAVWDHFEDKTTGQVVEEIAADINRKPDDLKEPVENIVSQLREVELLS